MQRPTNTLLCCVTRAWQRSFLRCFSIRSIQRPPLLDRRNDLKTLTEKDISNIERILQSGNTHGQIETFEGGQLLSYNSDWTGTYRKLKNDLIMDGYPNQLFQEGCPNLLYYRKPQTKSQNF